MNKNLKIEFKKAQLMIVQLREENIKHKESHSENAAKTTSDMNEIECTNKNAKKIARRWLIIRTQLFNLKR